MNQLLTVVCSRRLIFFLRKCGKFTKNNTNYNIRLTQSHKNTLSLVETNFFFVQKYILVLYIVEGKANVK